MPLHPSSPQLKVQDELLRQIHEKNARIGMCLKEYNKLSRRYELLVNRKRVEVKKITDYSAKELIATLWAKFVNLFRMTR